MFNSSGSDKKVKEVIREIGYERTETTIGENSAFEGKLLVNGTIRIDGAVKGEVDVHGDVIMGEKGFLKGTLTAQALVLSGRIEGNIFVSDFTEIKSTGIIKGDIQTGNLVVERGGRFDGKCVMDREPDGKEKELAAPEQPNLQA